MVLTDRLLQTQTRKKYRKMKLQFEQKMRESDQLFKEEQQAIEETRMLAHENEYVDVVEDLIPIFRIY